MSTSINKGNQTLSFDFKNEGTGRSFNKLLVSIIRPGIYDGGIPTLNPDKKSITIPSFTCFIIDKENGVGVRSRSSDTYNLAGYLAESPYAVLDFEWRDIEANYVDIKWVSTPAEDQLVLARAIDDGAGSIASLDLTESSFIDQSAKTINLGDGIFVDLTGVADINIPGTDSVTQTLQLLFSKLADLTATNDNAVKTRHIDKSSVTANVLKIVSDIVLGGTGGTIAAGSTIEGALGALRTALKNGTGVDNSAIKSRHLDFGITESQVKGSLIPLGSNVSKPLNLYSDISIVQTDTLAAAIDKLATAIQEVGNSSAQSEADIGSLQDQIDALNVKMTNTEFLPIGTILPMDADTWVDPNVDPRTSNIPTNNPTMKGWWACTSANFVMYGAITPNLEDMYLEGTPNTGVRGVARGIEQGQNTMSLTTGNLPPHVHGIDHSHSGNTGETGVDHVHDINHTHPIPAYVYDWGGSFKALETTENDKKTSEPLQTGGVNGGGKSGGPLTVSGTATTLKHSHSFNINLTGVNTSNNATEFTNTAFDKRGKRYKIVYVRKCRNY